MKLLTNIKSSTEPILVEKSEDMVYVRKNIEVKTEVDPVFNIEAFVYTYDEEQYSRIEYLEKEVEELKKLITE